MSHIAIRWRLLAVAIAMVVGCLSGPATAARRHFGAMHLRGSVVAVSPNFVDVNVGGRHCIVPAALHPACTVGGSIVSLGALSVGQPCLVTVPALDAEVVGLAPGWVTLAEPDGVLLTVPVGEVPALMGMQIQLEGPSDNLVTDTIALALGMVDQGYCVLVPNPSVVYEPDYVDCGSCALDGTIQQIEPNYVVLNYNGAPLDVPITGSTFYLNGATVPVRSLRVGRHVRVHDAALVGTVASMQSNRLALRTTSGRTVSVPMSGTVASDLSRRVPTFARQSNGRMLAAPLAHAATLVHRHAQLLAPRTAAGSAHAMLPHRNAQLHPTSIPNLRARRPAATPAHTTTHLMPNRTPTHTVRRAVQPHLMPNRTPVHAMARPVQPHLAPRQPMAPRMAPPAHFNGPRGMVQPHAPAPAPRAPVRQPTNDRR